MVRMTMLGFIADREALFRRSRKQGKRNGLGLSASNAALTGFRTCLLVNRDKAAMEYSASDMPLFAVHKPVSIFRGLALPASCNAGDFAQVSRKKSSADFEIVD